MSSKKINILLADDEAEIAMLVSSVLARSGNTINVVEDGQAAIDAIAANPGFYELVITDSNMPGVSGIELIEHLRRTDYPGKIILLSGYITSELEEVNHGLKIDRIIQKPFAFSVLTTAVKELCAEMESNNPA